MNSIFIFDSYVFILYLYDIRNFELVDFVRYSIFCKLIERASSFSNTGLYLQSSSDKASEFVQKKCSYCSISYLEVSDFSIVTYKGASLINVNIVSSTNTICRTCIRRWQEKAQIEERTFHLTLVSSIRIFI